MAASSSGTEAKLALLCVGLCAAFGCAPDLRDDFPFDGALPEGSYITYEELGGGLTRTTVDASHAQSWVYLDLDTRTEIPGAEAVGQQNWDLAFQRYRIVSNGGVSGVGSVEVAALPGADFDGLVHAPVEGYLRDAPDGPDDNQDVDSAFLLGDGWYSYTLSTHGLQPRDLVYVVHTGDGGYFKLKLLGYYDSAGSSAHPSFHWGPVGSP